MILSTEFVQTNQLTLELILTSLVYIQQEKSKWQSGAKESFWTSKESNNESSHKVITNAIVTHIKTITFSKKIYFS
jgi:hypothetical protein